MKYFLMGILAGFLLLSGCAKFWYQDGRSFDQTQHDLKACQREAMGYADAQRTWGLGGYERKFIERCMQEKGYSLVQEKELPVRVKRESSPVFGIPGVAGSMEVKD